MRLTRDQLRGLIIVLIFGLTAIYRIGFGPLVHEPTPTMKLATAVALGVSLLLSLVAFGIIWLSIRVDDPHTKQQLRRQALTGGSSPLLVTFLIWLTGLPFPV